MAAAGNHRKVIEAIIDVMADEKEQAKSQFVLSHVRSDRASNNYDCSPILDFTSYPLEPYSILDD